MENNHFLDEVDLQVKKHRPTFLTVLCIITFIISGLMLISTLWGIMTFDSSTAEATMEEALIAMEDVVSQPGGDIFGENFLTEYKTTLQEQITYHTALSIISLLSVLLSLLGAYLMFGLKKIGFHLYVVSKLVGLSAIFIITISSMMVFGYAVIGLLTLAFIIMYGVNLKHMK